MSTVAFIPNGGSGSMAAETSTTPLPLYANTFTYVGYSFNGWNTASSGLGTPYPADFNFPFDGTVTTTNLYAQWVATVPIIQSAPLSGVAAFGVASSIQLETTGNVVAVTFVTTAGAVAGLTVSSSGLLTTTTTLAKGTYTISGTTSGGSGHTGTWTFTVTVQLQVSARYGYHGLTTMSVPDSVTITDEARYFKVINRSSSEIYFTIGAAGATLSLPTVLGVDTYMVQPNGSETFEFDPTRASKQVQVQIISVTGAAYSVEGLSAS